MVKKYTKSTTSSIDISENYVKSLINEALIDLGQFDLKLNMLKLIWIIIKCGMV